MTRKRCLVERVGREGKGGVSGARARALVLRYGRGWSSVQRATDPVRERGRARALLTLRCDGNCSEGETVHGKTNRAKFAIRPK